jgi:hypothetical protein
VGLKRYDAKGAMCAGHIYDGLMTQMHAIEIAKGTRCAPRRGADALPVSVNLHLTPVLGARLPAAP